MNRRDFLVGSALSSQFVELSKKDQKTLSTLGDEKRGGRWIFYPKPDITAYELALLTPFLLHPESFDEDKMESIETASRHLMKIYHKNVGAVR